MRQFGSGLVALLVVAGFSAAGTVEVKGPHICCKQCVTVVGGILSKVEGVSDVVADVKTKTVTFKAKDGASAKAGVDALVKGGFFGKATEDGKEIKIDVPAPEKGTKADVVTVKDVHVCCKQCQVAVNGLFKDAKVAYQGSGAQRTVVITGSGLETSAVLSALRKAGFNGTLEK